MKKYFYLLGILSLTASCGTATYMYDDVYDVAEGKSLPEEGYTDLIKDNEKDHKVVVDKKDKVTFGGYYPSNDQLSAGTLFSNSNNNCNCSCGHYRHSNQWRYVQPGWTYGNPNSLWFNNCSCNHWNNNLAYHSFSFGNSYNLYGYYDYWGGWNSYYPIGMDPYGYYAHLYGWYPYQWNNNNNIVFNGGSIIYNNSADNGNHFYGHRNPSSTGSSNTTVYAHTVKEEYSKPVSAITSQTAVKPFNTIVQVDGANGIVNKPEGTHLESNVIAEPFGAGLNSDPMTAYQSPKPISNYGGESLVNSNVVMTDNNYAGGTTVTNSATNHVAASNQFEVKYPTTVTGGTSSGQANGGQQVNPVNQNSGTPTYYPAPVVTNTSGTYTTTSTSRGANSSYNSSGSNTYSGSNTTSHRTTTSTTNSGSGSTTTSGGSRTTSTSRR